MSEPAPNGQSLFDEAEVNYLRYLTTDLNRDYQPRGQTPGQAEKKK